MRYFAHLTSRLLVTLLASALSACIVVPEKVASYDQQCGASTKKIELTVEQIEVFDIENCIVHSCTEEIIGALAISTLALTTSTVVSGSIALVGNTVYWLESQGECDHKNQQPAQPVKTQQEQPDEKYLFTEVIVTAKS